MSEDASIAVPLPQQVKWQDYELGILYSFDSPVYLPQGWQWTPAYKEPVPASAYNPTKLDTDQWLQASKDLGARYAIFTATHMGGFLQWQSNAYEYGLRQSPWRGGKGDVVKDFVESCRRIGVAPGIFLSWRFNAFWGIENARVNFGAGGDHAKQAAYERAAAAMFTELVSRYGDLCEIWFDGGAFGTHQSGPDVLSIVDRYQPNTVFYHSPQRRHHRWVGNEKGVTEYPCWSTMTDLHIANELHQGRMPNWADQLAHGDPDGHLWSPGMCDPPIREHEWFWRPGDEKLVRPPEELVDIYYKSVGRNCNLIIGAVVDRDGLVPQPDMDCFAAVGRELRRRFGSPLATASGRGDVIELALPRAARVNHASIMEDIAYGHRIRAYRIDALQPGDAWKELCSGTAVGHKRIERFDAVQTQRLRLTVTQRAAEPIVRELAAHDVALTT